jgi:hypothetical protein
VKAAQQDKFHQQIRASASQLQFAEDTTNTLVMLLTAINAEPAHQAG